MIASRIVLFAAISFACFGTAGPVLAAGWVVDSEHSRLGFIGEQGGTPFEGRFSHWSADIDFDPTQPSAGHALVLIDLASATTNDRQRDTALPESDWFDVAQAAQARFEAKSFRAIGGTEYLAEGTLTLRGVSRPTILPFTLTLNGASAHAAGQLALIRTDYGVGQGPWSTGQIVALTVTVTVDVTATAKP